MVVLMYDPSYYLSMLSKEIKHQLLTAEAKSLATYGSAGVNVIAVYSIDVTDEAIILYNFFMGKTIENIIAAPEVALAAWSGFVGVQVKGVATYVTEGERFDEAVVVMKEKFPERTLRGLVVLTPRTVYDISAKAGQAGQLLH
jgi:predicted pyridoxine 5'-phosphate oxidase superfamily flavin-nucleotide-binding protein